MAADVSGNVMLEIQPVPARGLLGPHVCQQEPQTWDSPLLHHLPELWHFKEAAFPIP